MDREEVFTRVAAAVAFSLMGTSGTVTDHTIVLMNRLADEVVRSTRPAGAKPTKAEIDRHHAETARVAKEVLDDETAIAKRMTLPWSPECPNLRALRREAGVIVAIPQPSMLRAEFYAPSREEAVEQITRFFPRDDLVWAAERRGVTGIKSRTTRTDLARALVHLGPAWFDELDATASADEYDERHYDDEDMP